MGWSIEKGMETELDPCYNQPYKSGTIPQMIFLYDLPFHSSWNWLMPVIDNIEKLGCYEIPIKRTYVRCLCFDPLNLTQIHLERITEDINKISATYKCVIEFINWYNQQNDIL